MKHILFILLLAFTLSTSCTTDESELRCYNFELNDKDEVLDFENQRRACITPDSINGDYADRMVSSVELMDNGVLRICYYILHKDEVTYHFEATKNDSMHHFIYKGCPYPTGLGADEEMLATFMGDLIVDLSEDYGVASVDTVFWANDGTSERHVEWRQEELRSRIVLYYATDENGVVFSTLLNLIPWGRSSDIKK